MRENSPSCLNAATTPCPLSIGASVCMTDPASTNFTGPSHLMPLPQSEYTARGVLSPLGNFVSVRAEETERVLISQYRFKERQRRAVRHDRRRSRTSRKRRGLTIYVERYQLPTTIRVATGTASRRDRREGVRNMRTLGRERTT